MARPVRMWAQDEKVITSAENAISASLAADAATGTSWWQGYLEADNTSTSRIMAPPLILTVQDLFDPPLVEIDLWGRFENQNAGAALNLSFGANLFKPNMDAEEHAVQTGVGPCTAPTRYTHQYAYTPGASPLSGSFRWLARMGWGLQKTIDHDTSVMAWKQHWWSQLTVKSDDNAGNGFFGGGVAVDTWMGWTNYDCTNGMRITPWFRKNASHQLRLLLTGGIIRPIPENNRPSLTGVGQHGGF